MVSVARPSRPSTSLASSGVASTEKPRARITTSCPASTTCTNTGTPPGCASQIFLSATSRLAAPIHADAARPGLGPRRPWPRGAAQGLLEQPHVLGEDHAPLVAVVHA